MLLGLVWLLRKMGQQRGRVRRAPVRLIDAFLGARASVARCPSAIQFQLQFFFSCSPRDELFPAAARPLNRDPRRAVISKLAPVRY